MNKYELIQCIELLCQCVSFKSSEIEKKVILENVTPSSFGCIMYYIFAYLEMH